MESAQNRQGNYWLEQVQSEPVPAASGRITADVVVVGGGIAGLSVPPRGWPNSW